MNKVEVVKQSEEEKAVYLDTVNKDENEAIATYRAIAGERKL